MAICQSQQKDNIVVAPSQNDDGKQTEDSNEKTEIWNRQFQSVFT